MGPVEDRSARRPAEPAFREPKVPTWIAIVLLVGLLGLLGWRLGKERQIFALRVESGEVASVRGRIPQGLLADLQDVLAGSRSSGTVVATRDADRAQLDLRGSFPPEVRQRLRNVVGRLPVAKILSAPRR